MEQAHRMGICSFALAALGTYFVIICGGLLIIPLLAPLLLSSLLNSAEWLRLALPLVGISVILGTINVSRSLTLFGASFGMAFLLMWLV
jgi:PTS system mannose-specific IIC component